jgi:hypothetical protein
MTKSIAAILLLLLSQIPFASNAQSVSEDPVTALMQRATKNESVKDIKINNTQDCEQKINTARNFKMLAGGATIGGVMASILVMRQLQATQSIIKRGADSIREIAKMAAKNPSDKTLIRDLGTLVNENQFYTRQLKDEVATLQKYNFGDKDLEGLRQQLLDKSKALIKLMEPGDDLRRKMEFEISEKLRMRGYQVIGYGRYVPGAGVYGTDAPYEVSQQAVREVEAAHFQEDLKLYQEQLGNGSKALEENLSVIKKKLGQQLFAETEAAAAKAELGSTTTVMARYLGYFGEFLGGAVGGALLQTFLDPATTTTHDTLYYSSGRDGDIFNKNVRADRICGLAFNSGSNESRLLKPLVATPKPATCGQVKSGQRQDGF